MLWADGRDIQVRVFSEEAEVSGHIDAVAMRLADTNPRPGNNIVYLTAVHFVQELKLLSQL